VENNNRPDLSARSIVMLTGSVIVIASGIMLWPAAPAPGSALAQLCGALGALLLLVPLAFVIMKRSGLANSPPAWFIGHVLATSLGTCLIFIHVAAGDWISPPGAILLLLVFLILQGSLLRAIFSRGFSLLFARSSASTGFSAPGSLDKVALQGIIDAKTQLLGTLDPAAEEALFSPALKHWLRHPWKSFRYLALAEREARMIGARASAGVELGWSRRIHMLAALGFYLGLVSHIVVVLFFAGYAADGGSIDWWYITDWGG